MKKRLFSLLLVLSLLLGLCTVPAFATGDISRTGQTTTISAGDGFSAVIDENGFLWMWGHNGSGQVGNGRSGEGTYIDYSSYGVYGTEQPCQTVPVKVLDHVASVSCGQFHTAAIKTDSSLWMWDSNSMSVFGNDGVGNAGYRNSVQTVPAKIMDGVSAISCGPDFSILVKQDGSIWSAGGDFHGRLANNARNVNSKTWFQIRSSGQYTAVGEAPQQAFSAGLRPVENCKCYTLALLAVSCAALKVSG